MCVMKNFAKGVLRVPTLLLLVFLSGCAALGIVRRVPMIDVRDETVAAAVGTDLSDVIVRAATARRWSATVSAPDVVRCRFDGRSWNIVVDVRHSGSTFSIDYVSTEGLFYRPEQHDIHGTYTKQVDALSQRIKREAMRAPSAAARLHHAHVPRPHARRVAAPPAEAHQARLRRFASGLLTSHSRFR